MTLSTRVAIIEDDPATAAALRSTVETTAGLRCVGTAHSYAQGRSLLRNTSVDLVLLDLDLGDGSGLNLAPLASAQSARILVLTVFGDQSSVIAAVEAGASGYLLKDADECTITKAIADVLDDQTPISPAVAGHLLQRIRKQNTDRVRGDTVNLTPRETEVLEKLARGYTYREVGSQCGITYNTVSFHVKQIYDKLQASSRSEAIYKAVNGGIINIA